MENIIETIAQHDIRHVLVWNDERSGLLAFVVIDNVTLGPAAGGIRTLPYPSLDHALTDAAALAKAMTYKCALAGLRAGGGKIVVVEHGGLDRAAAFAELGRRLNDLGGLFRAGSDLGTGRKDLDAAGAHSAYVHTDLTSTAGGVARGVMACIRACARHVKRDDTVAGLRIAVQGCGAVGEAVVRALTAAGAEVALADVDAARARRVAAETGATVLSPEEILFADVDVVAPCAGGQVLTKARVERLKAFAVCGGANNILAAEDVSGTLSERNILFVPDVVSSAGGVMEGLGKDVMNMPDRGAFIDGLGDLTDTILSQSAASGRSTSDIALDLARERLAAGPVD